MATRRLAKPRPVQGEQAPPRRPAEEPGKPQRRMVILDRIRLTGLLPESPADAGLSHSLALRRCPRRSRTPGERQADPRHRRAPLGHDLGREDARARARRRLRRTSPSARRRRKGSALQASTATSRSSRPRTSAAIETVSSVRSSSGRRAPRERGSSITGSAKGVGFRLLGPAFTPRLRCCHRHGARPSRRVPGRRDPRRAPRATFRRATRGVWPGATRKRNFSCLSCSLVDR